MKKLSRVIQTIIPYLINYERKYYVSPFASAAPSSGATRADCSLSTATVPRRESAARPPRTYAAPRREI